MHAHAPAAAPVVVVKCGDFRTNRPEDHVIIVAAIDHLAVEFNLVKNDDPVEFDLLAVPGPQVPLFSPSECADEYRILLAQLTTYLSLHGGELIVVVFHFDCGREGQQGQSRQHLFTHAQGALRQLQRHYEGRHSVAAIFVEIDLQRGRTRSARGFTLDELGEELAVMEKSNSQSARPHDGAALQV